MEVSETKLRKALDHAFREGARAAIQETKALAVVQGGPAARGARQAEIETAITPEMRRYTEWLLEYVSHIEGESKTPVTSLEEVRKMRDAIQQALDNLPDIDAFGAPNAQDKRQMHIWIRDLDRVLASQSAVTAEVTSWISGEDAYFLNYYLS